MASRGVIAAVRDFSAPNHVELVSLAVNKAVKCEIMTVTRPPHEAAGATAVFRLIMLHNKQTKKYTSAVSFNQSVDTQLCNMRDNRSSSIVVLLIIGSQLLIEGKEWYDLPSATLYSRFEAGSYG